MSIQNPLNPLENPNDIDLKSFSNKKIIFNAMWERDINSVRKLELDAFRSLNSNVSAVYIAPQFVGSPIDGTSTKTSVTLFLVRKRLIKLLDIWNRILNSGLFVTSKYINGGGYLETKIVGSNLMSVIGEYLFRPWNNNNTVNPFTNLDFGTASIYNRITNFLIAYVKNYNWFIINNVSNSELFGLTGLWPGFTQFTHLINIYHNPTKPSMMALIEELVTLCKSLLSETKIASKADLGFNFDNLTFLTKEGRANILKLDTYKSNYKEVARLDISDFNYLNNPESLAVVSKWINEGSNLDKLYPQFGTEIYRNEESEPWNYKNVIVDLASFKNDQSFTEETLGLTTEEFQKVQAKKYWTGSQLDMRKPLYFNTQFINWANPDEHPYVMLYNGGTLIHIPDEVKEAIHPVTFAEKIIEAGSYTITGSYVEAEPLPINMYAMEFTFQTPDINITDNYAKKVFGPKNNSARLMIIPGSNSGISWEWDTGQESFVIFDDGYRNKSSKIKIENFPSGSNLYINDILVSSSNIQYNFNTSWGYSSNDTWRRYLGTSITNLKYFYNYGNVQEEAPDNQLNLAANFWKIGTSNQLDPLYNPKDDIKLRLGNQSLNDVDKLDFFDNLTLYLKLNQ